MCFPALDNASNLYGHIVFSFIENTLYRKIRRYERHKSKVDFLVNLKLWRLKQILSHKKSKRITRLLEEIVGQVSIHRELSVTLGNQAHKPHRKSHFVRTTESTDHIRS